MPRAWSRVMRHPSYPRHPAASPSASGSPPGGHPSRAGDGRLHRLQGHHVRARQERNRSAGVCARRFYVVCHVRPKLAWQRCDAISQAPAPLLPVPRGRAGPRLLAHVVVSTFVDYLPLYRQPQVYAREGVDLRRSTLADWLGHVSWVF